MRSRNQTEPSEPARGASREEPSHSAETHGLQTEPQRRRQADSKRVLLGFRLLSVTFAMLGVVIRYAGYLVIDGARSTAPYAGGASGTLLAVGVVVAAYGVVQLAAGYGTWTLKSWGRRLALGLVAVGLVGSLITMNSLGLVGLTGLALYGGMAWYLYSNGDQYDQLGRPTRNG
jgi:hypothetical protein